MTTLATILALSLLTALIAAGFVWYGWALTENLRAVVSMFRKPVDDEPIPVEKPAKPSATK